MEQTYQKKTHKEQILLRPDTYIGGMDRETGDEWVWDNETMVHRTVTYVPGLIKLFDEILVNASDNAQRDDQMTTIRVNIANGDRDEISVYNDGQTIPIQRHDEYGCYLPELVFGHLLTSSNYDDAKNKTTGGRNGYGAKLTNIFSSLFCIETHDTKQLYCQEWRDNMSQCDPPQIRQNKRKQSYTKVSFIPDLARFGMVSLEQDTIYLLSKRVVDMAGTFPRLKVYLNGKRIGVQSFKAYVRLYVMDKKAVTAQVNERWHIGVTESDGTAQHVSFVNGICTRRGGTHVQYIAHQIAKHLEKVAKKKNKNFRMTLNQIKSHLFLFINCMITNPTFDSQSKVNLTTPWKEFGSTCQLSPALLSTISKCGVLDRILTWSSHKQSHELKKTDGRKKKTLSGIPKLEDANWAGTAKSSQCTLILTEGDSALALAVSGLSVVGRDAYGVYPLRGKFLNVKGKTAAQINANATVTAVKKILGLQSNVSYTDTDTLRYGHVMIMADQDQDGSHIKGLVLNLFQTCWPGLFRFPGFLQEFITPIVKARRGKEECLSFYTLPEYETWQQEQQRVMSMKGWKIKYYKGLATSTAKEGQEYFRDLERHRIDFAYVDEKDDTSFQLVFDSKKADMRKAWLGDVVPGTYLQQSGLERLVYRDFIHQELVLYSMSSNVRSIPSLMDGLKPGQRKILHACFDKKVTQEIKVAQLSGHVMSYAYHHGDASLNETIVGLAQDYVGSNNINVLVPAGQFGTRHAGGKNHSSARYIFTCLDPITRHIYHPDDDPILQYVSDDGLVVEPVHYVPILPMVLVNGASGIGTGWSTNVPNYNPLDIIHRIRCRLTKRTNDRGPLQPWYRGFHGQIVAVPEDPTTYHVQGVLETVPKAHQYVIRDLPIGSKWTDAYKEFLEKQVDQKKIKSFTSHHTDHLVCFKVNATPEQYDAIDGDDPISFFKLQSTLRTTNMVLFSTRGHLKKYNTVEEIIDEYYGVRYSLYIKRKEHRITLLTDDVKLLMNRVRFITEVNNSTLLIHNVPKHTIMSTLLERGYDQINGSYDYLLSMQIWSLTNEKAESLTQKWQLKKEELDALRHRQIEDIWLEDLEQLETILLDKQKSLEDVLAKEKQMMSQATSRKRTRQIVVNGGGGGQRKRIKNNHDLNTE